MMQEIRNVVFDMGGVLVDLDLKRCKEAFLALGLPQIAELIDMYYPADIFNRLEQGQIGVREVGDYIRALSGRSDLTDAQISHAYAQFLVGIPVAKLRQIKALREHGIKTYMLSNNNAMVMPYIRSELFTVDGLQMEDYFDEVYLSYQMLLLKPGAEIFQKMIDQSGMIPAQTLFIDDGQRNVEMAHSLGFQVYMPQPQEDFGHLFDEILNEGASLE